MPQVLVYSAGYCVFCDRAKSLLARKGVAFTEVHVDLDRARREEMVARSGRSAVPQIFIGARHVGGFAELYALERAGALDALLVARDRDG